jgi:O-acetyl-ADP-ribose deacetylase
MSRSPFRGRFQIVLGDITEQDVDAIVNAANQTLLGGGGVDGAIHDAAGPELVRECATLGGCETGQAKITRGYNLSARHVIHTVGPVWQGGGHSEDELLASCYRNVFALAGHHGLRTVSFPSISTGIFRFPVDRAARIALREIKAALESNATLERVTVVCFDRRTHSCYEAALAEIAKGAGHEEE